MCIDYVVTADMPNNQPLPPYIDNGVIWHVVRRRPDETTLWRRISIQANTTKLSTAAARSRGHFLGGRSNNTCRAQRKQYPSKPKQRRKN
jgi:hypothetical protein